MAARVLLYDRTCSGPGVRPGLSTVWGAGATLYRTAGRIDVAHGVTSWDEAARALETAAPSADIEEVQYWGHGRFGRIFVARDCLSATSLGLAPARFFAVLRDRLRPSARALFWMRTCEAFGGRPGHDFAARLADFLGVPVAGHTYVIGFWQSGLHGLLPGAAPSWSPEEGVKEGTGGAPRLGAWSTPLEPRTISCLEGSVPNEWFDRS